MTGDDDVDKKVKNGDVGPGKSSSTVGPGQVHGSKFGWESFLHVRSIKVLLVEYDDCTRLVVTALLRNCNYEVIEASNGIQAWKILENLTNHIDLILTEVVMPCVSGVTLLTKIMSHKTRKNVPVIMMSSHDSMGLVFKCLSKGAVDFLVKPIRKNELKILWQHVWRRCASSSGSGSESGSQTQKSVKSTSSEKSENNKSKNDVDNNENTRVNNVGDESDDGCDSQNTWTKQLITIDSSKELSTENQVAECEDSTCAQVIHSHGEISESKKVQKIITKKCIVNQQIENVPQGNGLVTQQPEEKPENSLKVLLKQKLPLETEPGINTKILEKGHKVVCLFTSNPQTENKKFVASNILRHSELSAFSRYNSSSNTFKPPNGIVTNSSIIDNHTLEVSKKDSSSEKISTTLRGPHQNLETHHHHHDHSYHYHSFEHDKSSLKKLISMGSASGSNYVSNGQNGRTNLQSDKGLALESGSGSGTRRDEKRSAQREAALIKFLQKRKDRCYKKKVRYQNRKRVAESRPRVRGQFVKQTGEEGLNCETDK